MMIKNFMKKYILISSLKNPYIYLKNACQD